MARCDHPPISKFIAFKGKQGATVWRCCHCGKEDVWRNDWQDGGWAYWGPLECKCGNSGVEAVLCSDKCRAAFKPADPKLALEIAQARLEA